jgi:uncharacterized protein (DUF362 family)
MTTATVNVATVEFTSYEETVPEAFDQIEAGPKLAEQKAVLIKPNLVMVLQPPITTPVECCRAIVEYVREHSKAGIVIAEGCGATDYETQKVFDELGYTALSEELGVPLVDLNRAPTVLLKNKACKVFPEFHMPEIAMSHFIISVPVLKAHSLSEVTGSLKNMMGFAPPEHYQQGGHWKKSAFHRRMHESILDLNRYRTPDLSLLDARVGMAEYHLGGAECAPPVNRIVAGFDPLKVDRVAAELLGMNWRTIGHLTGRK